MAQPFSSPDISSARRPATRAFSLLGGIVVVTIILLATFALWLRYGTTVFFEMIAAGFAACF